MPHKDVQKGPCFGVRDEGLRFEALLFGTGGVATVKRDFLRVGQVCS